MPMPIYDYKCTACEKVTEVLQKQDDPPPKECPHCKAEDTLKRQLSVPSIELKGTGWARDRYS
jgi:putative FmdB family regulatory protein